jgi:hypothetical protein
MDEKAYYNHLFEFAKAKITWAKSGVNAPAEVIKAAVDDMIAARRALAKAVDRLDHMLGHPFSLSPCECPVEPKAEVLTRLDEPLIKETIPEFKERLRRESEVRIGVHPSGLPADALGE